MSEENKMITNDAFDEFAKALLVNGLAFSVTVFSSDGVKRKHLSHSDVFMLNASDLSLPSKENRDKP